ncbi:MAG: FKBP-type peptidyl-prolyl cis-trans isomerase [Prevotella sp.]|nr:FKBP-type peptidyl-prolyl cis-trans isomerase [Prevotella sp.]
MDQIQHKYIVLTYKLFTKQDGKEEMAEEATEQRPFSFLTGFGMALDAFEEKVKDLNEGEEFSFSLTPEQAYGNYEEAHVINIDKSVFTINNHFDHEHIFKGAIVPLQNEDGNHFLGKVLDINDEKVKMDLNHPLAGQELTFKGKIMEAREATKEEVEGFIKHIEQHHCGCGCEDCDHNCDHDHDCDHDHEHGDSCGCGCGHCH